MHPLFLMAIRNVRRNKKRTALTLAALIVGVTTMTGLRGFINAVLSAQIDAAIYGYTGMIQVHRAGYLKNILANPIDLAFEDTRVLREKILSVPGVLGLTPRIQFSGFLAMVEDKNGNSENSFMGILGVDPAGEKIVAPNLFIWTNQGRFLSNSESREIIINKELASIIKFEIDEETPESSWPALITNDADGAVNGEVLRPVGLIASAVPGDKRFALMPIRSVQNLLRLEGKTAEYTLRVKKLEDCQTIAKNLREILGPDFEVHTWDQIIPVLKNMTEDVGKIFYLLSLAFYFIIILGIVNAMFMGVMERTREIGTMMAVGFKRKQIIMLFICEGFFLSLIGAFLGSIIGAIIVYVLNEIGLPIAAPGASYKFMMRPWVSGSWLALSSLTVIVSTSLVSFWPAYRASRLNPVEALQSV